VKLYIGALIGGVIALVTWVGVEHPAKYEVLMWWMIGGAAFISLLLLVHDIGAQRLYLENERVYLGVAKDREDDEKVVHLMLGFNEIFSTVKDKVMFGPTRYILLPLLFIGYVLLVRMVPWWIGK
jgi:hypothetical protein